MKYFFCVCIFVTDPLREISRFGEKLFPQLDPRTVYYINDVYEIFVFLEIFEVNQLNSKHGFKTTGWSTFYFCGFQNQIKSLFRIPLPVNHVPLGRVPDTGPCNDQMQTNPYFPRFESNRFT